MGYNDDRSVLGPAGAQTPVRIAKRSRDLQVPCELSSERGSNSTRNGAERSRRSVLR